MLPRIEVNTPPQRRAAIRPERIRILDELSRPRTLEPDAFLTLTGGEIYSESGSESGNVLALIVLGVGPEPGRLRERVNRHAPDVPVFWVECPEFESQMPEKWHSALPPDWVRMAPEHLLDPSFLLKGGSYRIWRYAPGAQLFSSFWGQIIGVLQTQQIRGSNIPPAPSRTILLPGSEGDLLTFELEQAVRQQGGIPLRLETSVSDAERHLSLVRLLRDERPALFLSVNLRGLDPEGEQFHLLKACGVPVALWFVDNPWHVLSSVRLPWWREATIFVTDASFIEPLRRHGAASVQHLPLGAWMDLPESTSESFCQNLQPLVFVGRSSFPARDRFFAGCHIPENLLHESLDQLLSTSPPHAHWWTRRLTINSCWPDPAIRTAGFAADTCATLRRREWLRAAAPLGLTVFGDAAWKETLTLDADIRPTLDYYTELPSLYQQARYSLNITSLLLPAGLTQRHFDVWTAGGFLLTDTTPGLDIFPDELTRPVRATSPSELELRIHELEKDPSLRQHLCVAWRDCLRSSHTCQARLQTIMEALDLPFF